MGTIVKRLLAMALMAGAEIGLAQTPPPAVPAPPPAGSAEAARPGLMPSRPMAPAVSPEITKTRELISKKEWREASELIDSALAKRPRDPQWRFLQGVLFAETGKRAEAISVFELLAEDFPELSETYNNLAALYVETNELQKARLLLERAIQNRPDYALAHENLADVYTRLALQAYERASMAKQPSPSIKLKLDYLRAMPAIRSSRVLTNR